MPTDGDSQETAKQGSPRDHLTRSRRRAAPRATGRARPRDPTDYGLGGGREEEPVAGCGCYGVGLSEVGTLGGGTGGRASGGATLGGETGGRASGGATLGGGTAGSASGGGTLGAGTGGRTSGGATLAGGSGGPAGGPAPARRGTLRAAAP